MFPNFFKYSTVLMYLTLKKQSGCENLYLYILAKQSDVFFTSRILIKFFK